MAYAYIRYSFTKALGQNYPMRRYQSRAFHFHRIFIHALCVVPQLDLASTADSTQKEITKIEIFITNDLDLVVVPIPVNKPLDTIFDHRGGLVVKLLNQIVHVGVGVGHITRL